MTQHRLSRGSKLLPLPPARSADEGFGEAPAWVSEAWSNRQYRHFDAAPMKRSKKKASSMTKLECASGARKPAAKTNKTVKSGTKPTPSRKPNAAEKPASALIDERIDDLSGWRGETLARMRALILEADPAIAEEWKWAVPVWSHHGIVCTGEAYKKAVKLTFARGASVPDPAHLFNSSLEGNTRRAIDIHEGESVDASAFKALVKAAVAENSSRARTKQG